MTDLAFLAGDTLRAARLLLGWRLLHETAEGLTEGLIVETEAYTHSDPASHSYNRRTPRVEAMYGPPGTVYAYHIHQQICLNVVTGSEGVGEAVLIRALEPLQGVDLMRARRQVDNVRLLCAGPGRLCRAMGVTIEDNHRSLASGALRLEPGQAVPDEDVVQTVRVGISKAAEQPWRFYIASSRYISRR